MATKKQSGKGRLVFSSITDTTTRMAFEQIAKRIAEIEKQLSKLNSATKTGG